MIEELIEFIFFSGCNKAMLVKSEISILLLQPGKSSGPKWIYINF